MIRGIIYMYTSPSGKSYVGQTVDERRRRRNWFSSKYEYAGSAINRARAKYGKDSFVYSVLFSHIFSTKKDAQEVLDLMEQYYIQRFDTKKHGYNCDKGGGNHFGYKLSEEARKNISRGYISWASTPEGRAKLSAAQKGKPRRKGYRLKKKFIPVVKLTKTGEFIQRFPSVTDAGKIYPNNKATSKNISSTCKGQRDSVGEYKWMYEKDYYDYYLHPERSDIPQRVQRAIKDIKNRSASEGEKQNKERKKIGKLSPRINRFAKEIGQYDKDYKLVKVWRCGLEAAKQLNIRPENVSRATRTLGMYMGYFWRRYEGQQICEPKPKKKICRPKANKRVIQMDKQGNIIQEFESIGAACVAMGANNRASMSRCLNGKAHTAYGYKWKFLNCA